MKNEHAQLRGMTRGPWRANQQGCKPTMRFMKNEKIAIMTMSSCMSTVNAMGSEDPRMISQKPVYLFLQRMHEILQCTYPWRKKYYTHSRSDSFTMLVTIWLRSVGQRSVGQAYDK